MKSLISFLALVSISTEAAQIPLSAQWSNQVFRCPEWPAASDLQAFQAFLDQPSIDVWTERPLHGQPFDIRVSNGNQLAQLNAWMPTGKSCRVYVDNLWELVEREQLPIAAKLRQELVERPGEEFFLEYHSFDQLMAQVTQWASDYPSLTRLNSSIGASHEGRNLHALHITSGGEFGKKPVVWVNGGIHAREWISSHTAMFLVFSLLSLYGEDDQITKLVNELEFVFAPHINPDGYEYSRSPGHRMWRKNRRANGRGSYGVDLNRNYDVQWGRGGSSGSPDSDIYRGPYAASEPEVQACQQYIERVKPVLGLDLHAYGQLILRPYGFTMDDHPKEPMNKELGDGMRDAIYGQSKSQYTSQKSAGLYPVSGGMDDWMTMQGFSGFTIELRDTGRHGFVLPKEQILPTGREILAAFKFLGQFVLDHLSEMRSVTA